MRTSLLLALLLVAAPLHAADEGEKKKTATEKKASQKKAAAKKSAGSDKNVFQKAESNTGNFLHQNKIWTRQEKKQ